MNLPEVSSFFGIQVYINFSDHNPPHVHVFHGDCRALIDIRDASVLQGALPRRQLKLVLAWCEIHREELLEDWELVKNQQPPKRIDPLA